MNLPRMGTLTAKELVDTGYSNPIAITQPAHHFLRIYQHNYGITGQSPYHEIRTENVPGLIEALAKAIGKRAVVTALEPAEEPLTYPVYPYKRSDPPGTFNKPYVEVRVSISGQEPTVVSSKE